MKPLYVALITVSALIFIVIIVALVIILKPKPSTREQLSTLDKLFLDIDKYRPLRYTCPLGSEIPIYYINLDRSLFRRQRFEKQAQKYEIQNSIVRIRGVDGQNLTNLRYGDVGDFKFRHYLENGSKGEAGCALSHLRALLQIYRDGHKTALLFEDDISFVLLPHWPRDLQSIIDEIPKEDYALHMGFTRYRKDKIFGTYTKNLWGTYAYLLSRKAIEKFLSSISLDFKTANKPTFVLRPTKTFHPNRFASDECIYPRFHPMVFLQFPTFTPHNDVKTFDSTIHSHHTHRHIDDQIKTLRYYIDRIQHKPIVSYYVWKKLENVPEFSPAPIPKILHQTWKSKDLPDHFAKWSTECQKLAPHFEYKLWTDEDNRNLIKTDYPWFLETYESYDKPIKRVDAARYFILHKYGGLYLDLDFLCLRPFDHILETGKAIFGHQFRDVHEPGTIANAWMAAPPNHPLFTLLIHSLENTKSIGDVIDATGPRFLTSVINEYIRERGKTDVVLHKMPLIYSHSWNQKSDQIRHCPESTADCRKYFPRSLFSTVWTHTWKDQ